MPLRPILCFPLAGLLALQAPALDSRLPTLDPPSAFADGLGDWPMFCHHPARQGACLALDLACLAC